MEKMEFPDPVIEDIRFRMNKVIKNAHSEDEAKELIRKAMPADVEILEPIIVLYSDIIVEDKNIRRIDATVLYHDLEGQNHQIEATYEGE